MRRSSTFAVMLALVALAGFVTGCSDNSTSDVFDDASGGNVRLMVTTDMGSAVAASTAGQGGGQSGQGGEDESDDSPIGGTVVGASIRVSDFEARSTTLQQLVDISVELPVDVDLVALGENGGSVELAIGSLPPDTYDQLVLVISALILTGEDGTVVTIEPPGGGWTVRLETDPFEVVDGAVTTIQLQFEAASFRFSIDTDFDDIGADDFEPSFTVEVDHH